MEIGGDQWNAITETAMAATAADTETPASTEPAAANVSVSEVKTEESTKGNIYIELHQSQRFIFCLLPTINE